MPARDILFTNGFTREWDMESDSGLLRWLKVPFLYNGFQAVTVASRRGVHCPRINPDCLAYAQRTYDTRGTFVLGEPQSVRGEFAIHMSDESKVDA